MPNNSSTGGYLTPSNSVIDDAALDAVFQSLIVGLTGMAGDLVRPRWQPTVPKMPETGVDWCAVGVKDDNSDANPSIDHQPDYNADLGRDELSRQETIRVLAGFYGPNAKGLCKIARDGLFISQNREALVAQGIIFVEAGNIIAVPVLRNEQWVRGYDIELVFRRTVTRDYDIYNIATSGIVVYDEVRSFAIEVEENA